jgi:hypothetical protein
MPIKSFRGKIASGGTETISLHTNDGSVGYKITKFELLGSDPQGTSQETTMKIFSIPQTAVTSTIDFSDQTLLAVGYYDSSSSQSYNPPAVVVFDNKIFNQDVYITAVDSNSAAATNYHIEMEQVSLDLNENTVATLKDIRNIEASTF